MKGLIAGDDHRRVLACDIDVPEERPSVPLPLAAVGIGGKTVWVQLPEGRLPFELELSVDLPAERRGIHMSRLEEVIALLHEQRFTDLRAYGVALGREMIRRQHAACGRLALSGRLPVVRRTAVSERSSIDAVAVSAAIALRRQGDEVAWEATVSAEVCHITACPCTQAYNRVLFGRGDDPLPLPTHSQRSLTRLELAARDGRPTYGELIDCLEEALHVTQDLLKRPDEAEIVLKSHRHPQFAEDAVRETAAAVGRRFGCRLPAETMVEIESRSFESIHIHDVCCRLAMPLGEILSRLEPTAP